MKVSMGRNGYPSAQPPLIFVHGGGERHERAPLLMRPVLPPPPLIGTNPAPAVRDLAMLNCGVSIDKVLHHLDSNGTAAAAPTGNKKRVGGPFQIYDTGCREIVFLLCTLPVCGVGVDMAEEG